MKSNLLFILPLFSCLFLISCVGPAVPTGFLKAHEPTERDHTTLFQRSWKKTDADFSKYRKVYIAPVDTTYTKIKNTRYNERNLFKRPLTDDVKKNAVFMENSLKKAFTHSKKREWDLISQPKRLRDALIVEAALVEIAPSRPSLEAVSTVVRGAGVLNNPVTAIEMRVTDARSGKILASFADRDMPPIAILDLAKIRFYKAQQNVMNRWAKQTVRWLNGNEPNPALESIPFRPITW